MQKRYKVTLKIIGIFLFILLALIVAKKVFSSQEVPPAKVIDSIEKFEYTLDDRDTKLMKDNYNELKNILNTKEVDIEEYAKSIAKLFIIDLFTLDNKVNKYDVGGLEYVYPSVRNNYKLNVENTLYKAITVKANRTEALPIVKSIEVTNLKKDNYKLNNKEYTAFIIDLKWVYEKDLNYDKLGQVICLQEDSHIYVVEYKALGENKE